MALVVADRIKETTTTQGTSTYTLAGPMAGFQSFSAIGNANTTYYCCTDGTDFEIGIGTYTASGTTLERTTILQSSNDSPNTNAEVNWGVGTREIFVTQPADKAVFLDGDGKVGIGTDDPQQLLHVAYNGVATNLTANAGADLSTGLRVNNTNTTTDTYASIDLRANNADVRLASVYKGANQSDFVVLVDKTGGTSLEEALRVSSEGNVTITSSDTGDADAPILKLNRNSASPADNDDLGRIEFNGKNDAGQDVNYGAIFTEIADASDGTEDARLKFITVVNGSPDTSMEVKFGGVAINGRLDMTTGGDIRFEGTEANNHEIILSPGNPSDDHTITMPDASGTFAILNASGHLNFPDSTAPNYDNRLRFGAGNDLQIFSDGTHGFMQGAGNNDLTVAFDEVIFKSQDYSTERLHITSAGNVEMSNGSEFMAKFIANGACELYQDNSLKFNTTSLGTASTGIHTVANGSGFGAVEVGGSTGAHIDLKSPNSDDYDFRLIHTGSSGLSQIQADDLHLQSVTGAENYITAALNGAVELYHDNNLRLTTTTDGVKVTGGAGDATLTIEADTDNSDENDNPALVFSQDGGSTVSRLRLGSGNATVLEAHTNGALILQSTSGDDFLVGNQNAGVELCYDGSERLTTASSGIVTTSPALANQGTYANGVARALFTHTVIGNNPSNIQYVKIATLPATDNGTLDHLTIEGQVGGWTLTTAGFFKISFSRRNGFSYFYDAHSDIQTTTAVQAYQQSDGTVQIWGKLNASTFTKLSYSIPHSFQVTIEENPSLTETAPSGTLAFDSSSSTYAPRFQVDDAGNLSATTKSFDIPHPTQDGMRLRYGSLEGPENGVYVRGRLTGASVIELPEHWAGLVDEDSITVQLTAIGKSQDLWVEDVSIEQVKVCDANTDCFYMVMAERIDVAKLEVEYAN